MQETQTAEGESDRNQRLAAIFLPDGVVDRSDRAIMFRNARFRCK
jgi:hypothetical protein